MKTILKIEYIRVLPALEYIYLFIYKYFLLVKDNLTLHIQDTPNKP